MNEEWSASSSNETIHSLMSLYMSVLPMFKSLILVLKQKVPMVHRIHGEVVEFVERFFTAFIPVKKLKELTPSGLRGLDVSNPALHHPLSEVFLGKDTEAIVVQWTALHVEQANLMAVTQGLLVSSSCNWQV